MKNKKAGARRKRTDHARAGEKGAVEDLRLALTKAFTELEIEKAYNSFIDDFFARVSKPLPPGERPQEGWEEVQGDPKVRGVGRPQDMPKMMIPGKGMMKDQSPRYQMPSAVYKRYQMVREMVEEASTATRVLNSLNRYWRVNILFHPGSAATNFISGGLQYGSKIVQNFYEEVLTGNATMPKTRQNIYAMLTTLTPKGWQAAPDWIYGGDQSNFYGMFLTDNAPGVPQLDKNVDTYADKVLKVYGVVERYWKKVIATSEGGESLASLNLVTKEGLRLPTDMEKEILDAINQEADFFAYDYDNVPNQLQDWQRSAVGQAVKPFVKYPYKYVKHITGLAEGAMDSSLPWQERVAKILTLATMVALYAALRAKLHEDKETEEVNENAPASVSTRGRIKVWTDEQGRELFTRVAKYPFMNITEAGLQLADGNVETARQMVSDMVGGVAPAGATALALLGYKSEYEQYTPLPVIAGKSLASFFPGSP